MFGHFRCEMKFVTSGEACVMKIPPTGRERASVEEIGDVFSAHFSLFAT